MPSDQWSHVWLASAYAQSGQLDQARVEAAEVLRINPGFTIESAKRRAGGPRRPNRLNPESFADLAKNIDKSISFIMTD
jgi:hypothetical protein